MCRLMIGSRNFVLRRPAFEINWNGSALDYLTMQRIRKRQALSPITLIQGDLIVTCSLLRMGTT